MPDVQAVPNVVAQAQELGADVLARLDAITKQSEAGSGVEIERYRQLARVAIEKIYAVVEEFMADTSAGQVAMPEVAPQTTQEAQAASDAAEIERLKASVLNTQ